MSANQPMTRGDAAIHTGRFSLTLAKPFIEKSLSDATRAAYRRTVAEFFRLAGNPHPSQITTAHVIAYRDHMRTHRLKPNTVATKLAIVRSFFEYLKAGGLVAVNPASTKLVPPPKLADDPKGRALAKTEVKRLLRMMPRDKPEGARDYAMILLMLRLALRLSEVCSLRVSSMKWSHGRWTLVSKIKGGREERWPLPADVKEAIDKYLKLDKKRRLSPPCHSGGDEAYLFQPFTNYRTLVFDKPLSPRQVQRIVTRYARLAELGPVTPHDLRRTALTEMLKTYTPKDVLMVSKHKDYKTLLRYDHARENMDRSPVNTFTYDD